LTASSNVNKGSDRWRDERSLPLLTLMQDMISNRLQAVKPGFKFPRHWLLTEKPKNTDVLLKIEKMWSIL
jgi:hypothetical protein